MHSVKTVTEWLICLRMKETAWLAALTVPRMAAYAYAYEAAGGIMLGACHSVRYKRMMHH